MALVAATLRPTTRLVPTRPLQPHRFVAAGNRSRPRSARLGSRSATTLIMNKRKSSRGRGSEGPLRIYGAGGGGEQCQMSTVAYCWVLEACNEL
jgi:hypothetical protein